LPGGGAKVRENNNNNNNNNKNRAEVKNSFLKRKQRARFKAGGSKKQLMHLEQWEVLKEGVEKMKPARISSGPLSPTS
jgi:hypothetical protein